MSDSFAPWDDAFFQKGKSPTFTVRAFGQCKRFRLGEAFTRELESLSRLQRFRLVCQYLGNEAIPYIVSYSGARETSKGFHNSRTKILYLPGTLSRALRRKAYAYIQHIAGMTNNHALQEHLASVAECIKRNIFLPKFYTGKAWKITVPDFTDAPKDDSLFLLAVFTG